MLYCNREELRRLWLELVEQRRCLELVDQLDRLRSTPDALGYLVTARAWSEATSLMINSNYMLESEIASIPAVQTLKTDLAHKNKVMLALSLYNVQFKLLDLHKFMVIFICFFGVISPYIQIYSSLSLRTT